MLKKLAGDDINTDTEHLDITNHQPIREVVKREKVEAIVNCAAWTIVDGAEAPEKYELVEDGNFKNIHVVLKYGKDKNEKVITGLKKISKPGLRVYANCEDLPHVLGGLGIAIVSTNKGVMTDKEARKLNVGGEVLAFVW